MADDEREDQPIEASGIYIPAEQIARALHMARIGPDNNNKLMMLNKFGVQFLPADGDEPTEIAAVVSVVMNRAAAEFIRDGLAIAADQCWSSPHRSEAFKSCGASLLALFDT